MGTGTGTSTGTLMGTAIGVAMQPDFISTEIKIKNSLLCMKKTLMILEDQSISYFPVAVATKSEFLGSTCHFTALGIQPVEICIYLDKEPENTFFNDEKNDVRVIRKGTESGKTPRRSKLPVTLEYTKEADPLQVKVLWELYDTNLNHDFSRKSDFKTEYKAPTQDAWERQNKPSGILFHCRVGPDEEEKSIDRAPEEMYSTANLESKIMLKSPLGFAKVKCNLSPSDLPKADQMDLINKNILENFHREFFMIADLQKIADEKVGD
jgi:hypothetical protein